MVRDNRETERGRASGGEEAGGTPLPEEQADGASATPPQPVERERDAADGVAEAAENATDSRAGVESGTAELSLPDALDQLQMQRDKYLRLAAEFDNFRKRTARERQEAGMRAQAELLKRILDSLDDLDRATSVDTEGVDAHSIVEGIRAVDQKLMRTLADAGLEVINPLDEPFDPEHHEAIATEPALSSEDDHLVARVYQPGYSFRGLLLRPARVVVKQWAE